MATPIPTDVQMKQEANKHLRDIRKRKGVEVPDGQHSDIVEDLNCALNILSDQLYKKPTHFLLELIQNADDNTFTCDTPTISMTLTRDVELSKRYLCIDCNEVGFDEANVEALCRIGASTKKRRERSEGYIGEKGIGFKSVFKVADTVHISSKGYAFKFDRHSMLGMIVPTIEAFPPAHLNIGQTQTLLEIKSAADFKHIRTELEKLEPQILIFLRRIRKLIIDTPDTGERRVSIRRLTQDADFDGKETAVLRGLTLENNRSTRQRYIIVRYKTTSLENDERRKNITATEIVLAFPVNDRMRPVIRAQKTYAYLPIDDYGFNYLIHGDFLLVANREGVDPSEWNHSVLRAVYRAFVFQAVDRFNENHGNLPGQAGLRYTWPLFLKDRGGTDEFWSKLKRWIFHRLAKEDVLECRCNTELSRPDSLSYIPLGLRFEGDPLVEDENTESSHLSFAYDPDIDQMLPELKKMGVKVMSFSDFVSELRAVVNRRGTLFLEQKSNQWHSQVARLLYSNVRVSRLEDIPLIPLRDGRWATPSEGHMFLEEDTSRTTVPEGLEINLVDTEACQDASRNRFFRWLGIKNCDQAAVCQLIIQRYSPFRPLSETQSIQDLTYLFQTPLDIYRGSLEKLQLLPAPPHNGFRNAKRFYIEYPGKLSILAKYASNPASNIALLHPSYLNAIRGLGKESEFVDWACSRLQLSTQPRLIDEFRNLTTEFKFLRDYAAVDLLLLLRDNWDSYSIQLKLKQLIGAISEMVVDCTDGRRRRLDETALPRGTLESSGPDLPFIKVPEPNDDCWQKFSLFGLLVKESDTFYLRELKALASRSDRQSIPRSFVQKVYLKLQLFTMRFSEATLHEFTRHPLVFIERPKIWVTLRDCVWDGPRLSSVYHLSTEFPLCKILFRDYLKVGNVTLDHVVHELECVTTSTSVGRLEELLLHLNRYLGKTSPQNCLVKLKGKSIIPVKNLDGVVCFMTYDSDSWYLADRQRLRDCFDGKLPLITFDVATVRKLSPLIQAMDLSKRLLSEVDTPSLEATGDRIYDEERSLELRRRVLYFQGLIADKPLPERSRLAACLEKLQVWGVSAIKLSHKVHGIAGAEDASNLLFDDKDQNSMEITYALNTEEAIVNFELSEYFIEFCGIKNEKLAKLVLPILTYPFAGIGQLLESHGLDLTNDPHGRPAQTSDSVDELSEEEDAENSQTHETTSIATSPTTPLNPTSSDRSSFLRDRIPALDERILSIQAAAAQPDMTPTLIMNPSQRMNNPTGLLLGAHSNSNETFNSSPRSGSGPHEANFAGSSTPSVNRRGAPSSNDAFEFGDMRSALPEIFATPTPSSRNGTSMPRRSHGSRFNLTPNSRSEPDPSHIMEGIHNQYIGLQGEVFINEWLSQKLQPEWDATRHWTSRNRNQIYPNNPFVGQEGDFADFTYQDTGGKLTELLTTLGFIHNAETWSQRPPIYHLEVKSTTEPCNEPFYMSNNQVEKARKYTVPWDGGSVPTDVYVVLRVYNLEKDIAPGFTAYVDPWAMYMNWELSFMARESFMVTPIS